MLDRARIHFRRPSSSFLRGLFSVAFVVAALASCHSSKSAAGTTTVQFDGTTGVATPGFTVAKGNVFTLTGLQLILSTAYLTCDSYQQRTEASAGSLLLISVQGSQLTPITSRAFTLDPSGAEQYDKSGNIIGATALYYLTNDSQVVTVKDSEAQGALTLTDIASNQISGSYDLTFEDGTQMAGSFTLPVCTQTADPDGGIVSPDPGQ